MSEERRIVNTNIRLNLNRAEDRRAYERMLSMDRKEYRSYSRLFVNAVNDYFDRKERLEEDPYLETREKEDAFLGRVIETIQTSVQGMVPMSLFSGIAKPIQTEPAQETMEDSAEDALGFVDSF